MILGVFKGDDFEPYDPGIADEFAGSAEATLRGAFRGGAQEAISRFDLPIDWDLVEPRAVEYGQQRGAELIGKKIVDGELVENPNAEWAIDETTRAAVRELVAEAVREGWSVEDFADELEESGVFGDARARMIARTELAIAEARGHVASFREAGVEEVVIYDGDSDPECQEANGQTWTLEEYEANPVEHPNCVRDARPLTAREREAA